MVSNDWEDDTAVTADGTTYFCYMGSNISRLGNCDRAPDENRRSIKRLWKTSKDLEKQKRKSTSKSGSRSRLSFQHYYRNTAPPSYGELLSFCMMTESGPKFERRLLGITWKD